MAKFHGSIGYAIEARNEDVYSEEIIERHVVGDIQRNSRLLQSSGNVIDNINISNEISIIADPFAQGNINNIRYLIYNGTKWKVSNVEVQFPRLILTLGGIYNVQSED